MNESETEAERLCRADQLLSEALLILDTLSRHDVAAHVDFALHVLRGTSRDRLIGPEDIPS
jgi:hypothetical protein